MIKVGTQDAVALRLGAQEIVKAYLGGELVFGAAPGPDVYTITASIDPAGSGTVIGTGQYQEGASVTLTAVVNDGYKFTGWKENGQTVSTDNPYTFTAAGDRAFTAAFEAKPASRLPAGYTEVEYVQSNNCAVNTNFKVTETTKAVVDFEPLSAPSGTDAMIVWTYYYTNQSYNIYFSAEWIKTAKLSGLCGAIGISPTWKAVNTNTTPRRMIVSMDYQNASITADGTTATFNNSFPPLQQANIPYIYLFGNSSNNLTIKAKMYSCKIYNGGSLVRDFVPCVNPSGVVGLYDLIGNSFYKSIGTGTFTAGPAV